MSVCFRYLTLVFFILFLRRSLSSTTSLLGGAHEAAVSGQQGFGAITHRNPVAVSKSGEKLVDVIREKSKANRKFFSMEISPKKNFHLNYDLFKSWESPIFTSITWFVEDGEYSVENVTAFQLGKNLADKERVLLHMNCYNTRENNVDVIRASELNNVMALRGDIVNPGQRFLHASDLVKYFRSNEVDDKMGIAVGGYPDVHPEAVSPESDLKFLKDKVDAGADFIITQVSFDADKILQFIKDCRKIGITVPIIPGVYVPKSYRSLKFLSTISQVPLNGSSYERLAEVEGDVEEFERQSIKVTVELIRKLMDSKVENIPGVHFFTLNQLELVRKVVDHFDFL